MNNEQISPRQFMFLVMLFVIGSSIIIMPSPMASGAKQDAWIAASISLAIGILLGLLFIKIGDLSPESNLVDASIDVFGKWLGRLIAIIFLLFIFILSSLVLRNIGDFMTTQIIPETPLQFTHILFLLVVIFGARLGIEVIGRTAEIFMPWIILLILFLTVFVAPQLQFENVKPVFENGWKPIVGTSLTMIGSPFLEMAALLMVYPYVKEKQNKKARKAWLLGVLLGGGFLVLITFLSILVLGSHLTALNAYPSYELGKNISIAGFLEGVEIIIAIIWMLTIFFKLIILFGATAKGFSRVFNMQDERTLLLPLGMIAVVLSIISYPDVAYFEKFVGETWFPYAITHGFLIPLLIGIGLAFKKKKQANTK
ncbi:GerAB/ArcD/ProY family transporter [Thalassobacillus hwangdonensis]|uniref:Endospore germination permease n=1 Tax=Thalassobacillus hwangdonensis TaxID=546108 RepID=A0ABW3KXS3_9BACI